MPKLKRKDLVFNNESHKQLSVGKSRWKKLTFGEVHKCVYVNLLLQFLSLCPLRISMCWNLVLVKVVWIFVWVNNRYFQDKTIQLFLSFLGTFGWLRTASCICVPFTGRCNNNWYPVSLCELYLGNSPLGMVTTTLRVLQEWVNKLAYEWTCCEGQL